MKFTLTKRGEMWRAAAAECVVEFVCPDITLRVTSAGMHFEASSREAAVVGILATWSKHMLAPLVNAGAEERPPSSPRTVTLI
jgi:hypothetical protein